MKERGTALLQRVRLKHEDAALGEGDSFIVHRSIFESKDETSLDEMPAHCLDQFSVGKGAAALIPHGQIAMRGAFGKADGNRRRLSVTGRRWNPLRVCGKVCAT